MLLGHLEEFHGQNKEEFGALGRKSSSMMEQNLLDHSVGCWKRRLLNRGGLVHTVLEGNKDTRELE